MKKCFQMACFCIVAAMAAAGVRAEDKPAKKPAKVSFQKIQLDAKFRSEGTAVGDFNRDGKLDISAGSVYYAAPDWKMVTIQEKALDFKPEGYSNSFANFAYDVNGDGWTDLIVVDFPGKQTWWFENPQTSGGAWKQHVGTPVTNNETPQWVDIDGSGKPALVAGVNSDAGNTDSATRQMAIVRMTDKPSDLWAIQPVSAKGGEGSMRYSHGLGVGDINGDGRKDVVVPQGWWESPAAAEETAEWKWHAAPLGDKCADMLVYDYDGDGDADIVSSSAHAFGIWLHEQTPEGWKTHLIDKSFSQTHAICLADINGDGLPDLVTGKRWWAHAKGDPGGDEPAVMFWFELSRKDGKAVFTPHQFDHDSGVGTQFQVADVDGDGLLDVVTSNKKGTHFFKQVRE